MLEKKESGVFLLLRFSFFDFVFIQESLSQFPYLLCLFDPSWSRWFVFIHRCLSCAWRKLMQNFLMIYGFVLFSSLSTIDHSDVYINVMWPSTENSSLIVFDRCDVTDPVLISVLLFFPWDIWHFYVHFRLNLVITFHFAAWRHISIWWKRQRPTKNRSWNLGWRRFLLRCTVFFPFLFFFFCFTLLKWKELIKQGILNNTMTDFLRQRQHNSISSKEDDCLTNLSSSSSTNWSPH